MLGACPAGGAHDPTGSGDYSLSWMPFQISNKQQEDWRWCHKCQGLFYGGNASQSICPKDQQPHDPKQSANYYLAMNTSNISIYPGQRDWRCCQKCQGLFFAGNPNNHGVCPRDKVSHAPTEANYTIAVK